MGGSRCDGEKAESERAERFRLGDSGELGSGIKRDCVKGERFASMREIVAVGEAESFHHRTRTNVVHLGEGDDYRSAEFSCAGQASETNLGGVAASPVRLAYCPADLQPSYTVDVLIGQSAAGDEFSRFPVVGKPFADAVALPASADLRGAGFRVGAGPAAVPAGDSRVQVQAVQLVGEMRTDRGEAEAFGLQLRQPP